MEEESITESNNVTADIFSHASIAQRENANEIFTSEKKDKSDKLVDTVKNLTINEADYYESNTATASDTQGDITSNPYKITHTSNIFLEQELLSYRTIPVLPPQKTEIVAIKLTPQTLLMPTTKEIAADAASGGGWMSRTTKRVSRTGVDGRNPGGIDNVIVIVETSF